MEFLYAAELKKRFTCYGHFYELVMMDGEREKCRSVLEIVDTSIPQENPSDISEMEPDAVVIMMNPGSSQKCLLSALMRDFKAWTQPAGSSPAQSETGNPT